MKILYISQSVVPSKSANSIHVMKTCESFANFNNKVSLVTYDIFSEKENLVNDDFKFYGVNKQFKIHKIKVSNNIIIREVKYFLKILWFALTFKPDLIYSRSIQTSFLLSLFGFNSVLEIHSPPTIKTNYLFKKFISSRSLDFLVVISKNLKKFLIHKYQIKNENIIKILPDAASINKKLRMNLPKKVKIKKKSIGYLGHLYEGRGIDIILDIAEHLPENNFYIVGGFDKLIRFWKSKAKSSNVYFLGFHPNSTCETFRKKFDYLIAPYQNKVFVHGSNLNKIGGLETSKWMSPLKIFEYMSANKPIISSKVQNIQEILNSDNSILCDPNNLNEWINAVKKLNNNRDFAKSISKNAFEDYKLKYTWDARVEKIIKFHKKINSKMLIFNFSLVGAGTEYVLSRYANILAKTYDVNFALCQKNGVFVQDLNTNVKKIFLNKKRVFTSFFALKKIIKRKKINIIITSMTHTNLSALLLKFFFFRDLKVIIRESNTISYKYKYSQDFKDKVLKYMAKKFYNYADKIISPTKLISDDLSTNFNVKPKKIIKLQNPCEINKIIRLSNSKIDTKTKKLFKNKYILSIGRLDFQKNYRFLIKSFYHFQKISPKYKNYKLYILGEGKDYYQLKKLIKSLKIDKSVYLLGFHKNPFIFMKNCELFTLTSKFEGHSNVLVHSQIMNNKIIASHCFGANKEVIGNNGLIYKTKHPKKLSVHMDKIIKSKKPTISQKKLFKKFNDEQVVDKFSTEVISRI